MGIWMLLTEDKVYDSTMRNKHCAQNAQCMHFVHTVRSNKFIVFSLHASKTLHKKYTVYLE